MRVADYIFNKIAELGVESVFLVPGGGAMYLVDALGQNKDIEFIPNHHEQASAIAAEAYSRINNKLGVALVTTGPGATNAITGVAGAWIESVPMLVISGQVKRTDLMGDSGVRQMGPQEVDIISMVKPITKYAVTVMQAKDIRYHLEKALFLAMSGRKGPVWLDIPLDIQAAAVSPELMEPYNNSANSLQINKNDQLSQQIKDVIQLINNAQRPILLAGHGIRLSGAALVFKQLIEHFKIPVVSTWNAMDLLPFEHPLYIGKPGSVALRAPNFAIQNSDLLITIGARLDNVVTAHNLDNFAKTAKKIVVDIDINELNKHKIKIEQRILSDAKFFISSLLDLEGELIKLNRNRWLEQCLHWKTRYPICDSKPFASQGEISHYQLTQVLSEHIPENTLIVTGSSGLGIEAFYSSFQNKKGQRIFLTSGLGAMGYGLPAMIGAAMASNKKKMVGIESDGSLQMNIQELQTIKSLHLPIIIFIINNAGYASIRNTQRNYFNERYVSTGPEAGLYIADICKVAEAVGIPSIAINNVEELIEKVQFSLQQQGPFICNVMVMPNETLWPKSATITHQDGSIYSMPLEDMTPLLPLEELESEMLVELSQISRQARLDNE